MVTKYVKKEVGSGDYLPSPKLAETKADTVLVTGIYQGTKTVQGKEGPFIVHEFDVEGKIMSLSSGQLNYKLKSVEPGTLVEVTFLGKKKVTLANGKTVNANQFHVVELEEVTETD